MPSAARSSYEREDFIELRIVHVYQPRQDHTYMMLSGEVSAIDILPRLKPWAFPPDIVKISLIQVPQSQTSLNLLIRLWSISWLLNGLGFPRQLPKEFACKKQ